MSNPDTPIVFVGGPVDSNSVPRSQFGDAIPAKVNITDAEGNLLGVYVLENDNDEEATWAPNEAPVGE
jgi:hypothetical protein